MAMEITFLGTNTLLFRKNSSTLLVDPHFTRPSLLQLMGKIHPDQKKIAESLAQLGIERLDGVLLTHTHYDHALDAAEVISQAGGVLYGSGSALNLLKGAGLGTDCGVEVVPGQRYAIGAFRVCFHPACHLPFPVPVSWLVNMDGNIAMPIHPPAWFWRYRRGQVYAIQVDRTLIFGSAGFTAGAYRDLAIDTTILGVGGMDIQPNAYLERFYEQAVLLPGAKRVFITHWDNFFGPFARHSQPLLFARRGLSRVSALGTRYGQDIHQLEYGTPIRL